MRVLESILIGLTLLRTVRALSQSVNKDSDATLTVRVPDAYVYRMRISTSAALRADPHEEEATRAGPTACGGGPRPILHTGQLPAVDSPDSDLNGQQHPPHAGGYFRNLIDRWGV
jgi:hypothetical protein